MKRGQITIFVIIGFLFILTVLLIMIIKPDPNKNPDIKPEINEVKNYIIKCLESTSKDSIDVIGLQGGYYKMPEDSYDLGYSFIPFYYDEGKTFVPSKDRLEKEISLYVIDYIKICIEELEDDNVKISNIDPKITVVIEKNKVKFLFDQKLTIEKDNIIREFELKEMPIEINSKIFDILEMSGFIVDSLKKDTKYVCVTCIDNKAKEKLIYVEMADFALNNTKLFIISENMTTTEGYYFEFLAKFKE